MKPSRFVAVPIIVATLLCSLAATASAATCTRIASDFALFSWNDVSKWDCGVVPGADDIAIIPASEGAFGPVANIALNEDITLAGLVMAGGRAEQIGSPEDLYQRPRNRFVAEFMGSSNIVAGTSLTKNGKALLQIGNVAVPRSGDAAADGRPMQFAVRPDAVGFDTDGLVPSSLIGTVVGSEFCGEYYRLHIETDDLGILASHIKTNTPPAIGTQGVLTWSAADMHQLSDDG